MAKEFPDTAMILAAGKGARMRPLTDSVPKPLLSVRGRPLIDHILDRLTEAGVRRVVVNLHHLAPQLRAHLDGRTELDIDYSDESDALLETGGGVKRALPLLGEDPFFVVNGDAFWLDAGEPSLTRLARAHSAVASAITLLMESTAKAVAYSGRGDYFMDPDGRLRRRSERVVAPFVFASVYLTSADLFRDAPDGAFSMNLLFDAAEANGGLYGLRHEGLWAGLNSPDSLLALERALAA